MERSDLLLTTAQIGMALAGFAGLFTLLGHPIRSDDRRLNEIRFRNMVELSLMLAAFSLVPFIPIELDFAEAAAWRISSGAYALAGLAFVTQSVARNRRSLGRVLVAGAVSAALITTCVLQSLTLALNALGGFPHVEAGVYFAALFVHFLGAAFFFIRLLYGALPAAGS